MSTGCCATARPYQNFRSGRGSGASTASCWGKHSGTAAVKLAYDRLGIACDDVAAQLVLPQVRALAHPRQAARRRRTSCVPSWRPRLRCRSRHEHIDPHTGNPHRED